MLLSKTMHPCQLQGSVVTLVGASRIRIFQALMMLQILLFSKWSLISQHNTTFGEKGDSYPSFAFTESIQNVTLSTEPDYASDGADKFTLKYSTLQGAAEQWMWSFNGMEIKSNSHYSVEEKSLVISRPKRNDTGRYTLFLKNPFSNATAHKNVTVLCKKEQITLNERKFHYICPHWTMSVHLKLFFLWKLDP